MTSLSFLLSCIGEGNGNPLQCSCLENPMEGGAWWAAVHGVAKSQTRLSDFTFTFTMVSTHKTQERILCGSSKDTGLSCPWRAGSWGMSPNSSSLPRKPGLLLLVMSSPCFPGGSDSKESACRQETRVPSLGQEDPLEEGMAPHSSILAWRIPWTEGPGGPQSMGSRRVTLA